MMGIVPAAGTGSRIQPLAFSKELLPVGSRRTGGTERPRAVSEYLLERMVLAGATRICFVIGPGKFDIVQYYGARFEGADLCYVVQPEPAGLCDALFRVLPFIEHEDLLVGLPDTVWFPRSGFSLLPEGRLSFLLFFVDRPEFFDAVEAGEDGRVRAIRVKQPAAQGGWIWGAFRLPAAVLRDLHAVWLNRVPRDPYVGTLVNVWMASGGEALGVRAGQSYVDVGTLHGYREAVSLLARADGGEPASLQPMRVERTSHAGQ